MNRKRLWCWTGGVALLCVILLGVVILICALCAKDSVEGDGYYIYEENGESFMRTERWINDLHDIMEPDRYPSVKAMQDALLSGEAPVAAVFSYNTDLAPEETIKTIGICDLRRVYDAVLPLGMKKTYTTFNGRDYTIVSTDQTVSAQLTTSGSMSDYVDNEYLKYYNDPQALFNTPYATLVSCQDVSDRNAREVVFKYNVYKNGDPVTFRFVFYTVQGIHGTVYVRECYENEKLKIEIFGEDGGADYYCRIRNLNERPSKAWLASFGIRQRLDLLRPFAY